MFQFQWIMLFSGLLDDKEDPYRGGSLFYHENGRSSSNYYDPNFLPVFDKIPDIPENR